MILASERGVRSVRSERDTPKHLSRKEVTTRDARSPRGMPACFRESCLHGGLDRRTGARLSPVYHLYLLPL